MTGGFDNRSFWEARYTTEAERGSGRGSRGKFLTYKQQLLSRLVAEFQPRSILDVGCGDLEATRHLVFAGTYTGIDLSASVIARDRTLRPDWTFIDGDFLALRRDDGLHADLVLAFDVLIHQHEAETYRAFVHELIASADKLLVMNGFDDPAYGSGRNVQFHEPLTSTVREYGVGQMRLGDTFRRTQIVLVEKDVTVQA